MLNKLLFVSFVSISLLMFASCKSSTTSSTARTTSSFQLLSPNDTATVVIDTVQVNGVWFKWEAATDLTGPLRYRIYLGTDNNFPTSYVRASDVLIDSVYFSYSDLKILPAFATTKTKTFYWTVYVKGPYENLRSQNTRTVTITLP